MGEKKCRISAHPGFTTREWADGIYDRSQVINQLGYRYEAVESENNLWPWAKEHQRDAGGEFRHVVIDVELGDWKPRHVSHAGNPRSYNSFMIPVAGEKAARLVTLLERDGINKDLPDWVFYEILGAVPVQLGDIDLSAMGSTAMSRVIPSNPNVALATSLAELISARKFFSLPGRSGSASGEYLNYQLGIAPVISDVKATYETAQEAERILSQYERDAGKRIRRRYSFPDELKVSQNKEMREISSVGYGLVPFQASDGELITSTSTSARTWFSGAFTYYLPKKGWRRKLDSWNRLYGVQPGLETAWNVIPYSFVADYFANIGDVLHNVDRFAQDGLVVPYAYIMREEITRISSQNTIRMYTSGNSIVTRTFTSTVNIKYQRRLRATPSNFGFPSGALSARQISILAALGLNRK